jgi:hypothetical protein
MKKTDKKPEFPRDEVIDRQIDQSMKKLKLKKMVVRTDLRAGTALYGLIRTWLCVS